MTGDSDGWDGLPPLDGENGRPPSSAPSSRGNMPSYGPRLDGGGSRDYPEPADPNATHKPVLRYVPGTPDASDATRNPGAGGRSAPSGGPADPGRIPSPPPGAQPEPQPSPHPGTQPGQPGPQRSYPSPGPLGSAPFGSNPGGANPSGRGAGLDDRTQELPSGYFIRDVLGGRMKPRPVRSSRGQGPFVLVISVLIVLGVLAALVATPLRSFLSTSSVPLIGGCGSGSPCQAATAFLADYGSGDYESMYIRVSSSSRSQFNDPTTRGGYKDAHDYIVNRTKAILAEAQITSIQTTIGETKSESDTKATVNAQVVLSSARVGQITQSLAIPLTKENGQWMVDWTPGLIFAQLDDPSDPHYQRLVHLFATVGTRGTIFDRDGNVLAKDDTVYDIDVDTTQIHNETALDNALATDLNMTPDQVKAAYRAGQPVRTITKDYFAKISGSLNSLPGAYYQQRTGRVYPYGANLAAVTGYVSGVTPDDLKNDTNHYYCVEDDATTCSASDVAGHAGVEQWAETYLRPQKGGTLAIVERNADGSPNSQPLVTIASRQPTNGADVHTTISLKDQQAAYTTLQALGFGAGSFAVDPASGQVLEMASFPACDPNDFSLAFGPGITKCTSTPGAQVNQALQSAVPIGSVFKLITLSAGLENGVSPSEIFTCNGAYNVLGHTFTDFNHDTLGTKHGSVTASAAIAPSCDIIPVIIAVTRLNAKDPNILPTVARGFGLGSPTNVVGVPQGIESAGLVPDPQWLKQNQQADWTAIDAANLAVGQGFLEITPAQAAMASAAIANNGVRMQPLLVTSITGPDGTLITSFAPKQVGKLPLSADNLKVIQTTMLGPTTAPNGTAYNEFRNFGMLVAGKTGTAESGQQYPHGWFVSYAPASPVSGPPVQAQIAMSVLVEYSAIGEFCGIPPTQQVMRAQFPNLPAGPVDVLDCQLHNGLQ